MKPRRDQHAGRPAGESGGLARALSKLGYCSRSQARGLIQAGRVRVNGVPRRDPEWRVNLERDRLQVDEQAVRGEAKVYLMLNKPRGLVTTASDEQGRDTVFECLAGKGLPFVAPVGRLDKASEGLLLLSNDTAWASGITDPVTHLDKTYHVQVAGQPDDETLAKILAGVNESGDVLKAKHAILLRSGEKNAWLEVVLDEGRNRHIRRLLAALGFDVLRLIRVAIGRLPLGELAKGQWRELTAEEVSALDSRR